MAYKVCVGCTRNLPYGDFYCVASSEDGRHRYCKQCCKVNRSLESVRKRDKKSKISFRQLYRAKKADVQFDESVKLVEVFRQYRGICAICRKWVQPRYASMDHIVPIIRGGTHTYDNLQLTHLRCNLRKGDRDA